MQDINTFLSVETTIFDAKSKDFFYGKKINKKSKKGLTEQKLCAIITPLSRRQRDPRLVSGCGADGSALPWGGRGRKFKSCHSDQIRTIILIR